MTSVNFLYKLMSFTHRHTLAISDPEYPFKLSAILLVSKSFSVETLFKYKFKRADRVSSTKSYKNVIESKISPVDYTYHLVMEYKFSFQNAS